MNKIRFTYLFLVAFISMLATFSSESEARQQFGALWTPPDDSSEAASQLALLAELGITHLEVDHPLSSQLQRQLNAFDFSMYINAGSSYFTLNEMAASQDSLLAKYIQIANRYRTVFEVSAIGLFRNSQTNHPRFWNVIKPVIDSLQHISNKNWYAQVNREWHRLPRENNKDVLARQLFGKHYSPADLAVLNQTMVSANVPSILFLEFKWIEQAVKKYPALITSFQNFKQHGQWLLPLPNAPAPAPPGNWLVFTLILLWGTLAAKLRYFPYVRAFVLRYFTAHRFYVDDILHYRERAGAASFLMMLIHAVFTGMASYICSKLLFSEAGMNALFYHYPAIALTGQNYISFFVLGMSVALLTQLLALFWLHLPAKNLNHLSQTANLYAPNFYLDYLIVTVMLTLYHTGNFSTSILILGGLFLLIWFSSFPITSLNISKTITNGKPIYLLITLILHIAATIILAILLITQTNMLQVIELALSL